MRITTLLLIGCTSICQYAIAQSSSDSLKATENALQFADQLVKANFYQDWKTYEGLSCPGAIRYYGGKDGFHEHIISMYYRDEPVAEEKPEAIKMVSLLNDIDQWQCVIQKTRTTSIETRKAKIYSYLVGQSMDNGATWKFFDVSHNTIENIIYIFPDIFKTMPIPEKRTVYDDELAVNENNSSVKKVAPKKPTNKRRK
jgi:hypothetical protein